MLPTQIRNYDHLEAEFRLGDETSGGMAREVAPTYKFQVREVSLTTHYGSVPSAPLHLQFEKR